MTTLAFITNAMSRIDPTRTLSLRNAFAREMRMRFRLLGTSIRKAVIEDDFLSLKVDAIGAGRRTGEKVNSFMTWLQEQLDSIILDADLARPWTNRYVMLAYQRGILRGRQELINHGYRVPTVDSMGGIVPVSSNPFHQDRLGLLYTRTYNDLKGIAATMSQQISRVLSQSMTEGLDRKAIARLLYRTIAGPVSGLGLTNTLGRFVPAKLRAEVLARTEVVRAHHVATSQEYRNWDVEGVTVMAEWVTAGDDRVCDECQPMEGKVFTLDEIEGMIPMHPRCRCVALPIDAS